MLEKEKNMKREHTEDLEREVKRLKGLLEEALKDKETALRALKDKENSY